MLWSKANIRKISSSDFLEASLEYDTDYFFSKDFYDFAFSFTLTEVITEVKSQHK